jgi:hypothetical protein
MDDAGDILPGSRKLGTEVTLVGRSRLSGHVAIQSLPFLSEVVIGIMEMHITRL